MGARSGGPEGEIGGAAECACASVRHADTADSKGPYLVSLRELRPTGALGGAVHFVAERGRAGGRRAGTAPLRRSDGGVWTAEIPGQPAGALLRYRFLLTMPDGTTCRHPGRARAGYRFRVLPVQVVSVRIPAVAPPGSASPAVKIRVRSPEQVSGEVRVRLQPLPADGASDLVIPLVTAAVRDGRDGSLQTLEGRLPAFRAGSLADVYFRLRTASGRSVAEPADAPARVYTIRAPLASVQFLPAEPGLVLDLFADGSFEGAATRGAGALWRHEGSGGVRWGLKEGLGSNIARFVRHDPVAGIVYVGTDRGVVAVEREGGAWLDIVAPQPPQISREIEALSHVGSPRRAGPASLSSLDGTLLFQVQGPQETAFLTLRDGALGTWGAGVSGAALAGMSALAFDRVDGCWLAGGWLKEAGALAPVLLRDCDGEIDSFRLRQVSLGDARAIPERIVAIARDPASSDAVVGVEISVQRGARRGRDFGVYRAVWSSATLVPLAGELGAIGSEVTSLATDWRAGRLLVGTMDHGVLVVQDRSAHALEPRDSLPQQITALSADTDDGSLLIGTPRGAFRLSPDGKLKGWSENLGPSLPHDALPNDVDLQTGRVLLASYAGGLFEIERRENEEWWVVGSLVPGNWLPAGPLGEARYGPGGQIWAIRYGRGLLRVTGAHAEMIGQEHGLRGLDLLRVLPRSRGEVWVAHTPIPFGPKAGGAVQVIEGARVSRTYEIPDRDLATMGRWIEVPSRDAIWAATQAGVVELRPDGSMSLLSRHAASSIAMGADGSLGAVGDAIERWDGKRFVPVLFRVEHPRGSSAAAPPGPPIDLAIDPWGDWFVLFRGGVIAWLDPHGRLRGVLDPRDGIAPSAQRLVIHSPSGDLLVGSAAEGVAWVRPARGASASPRQEPRSGPQDEREDSCR